METATRSLSAVTQWARAHPRRVDAAFALAVGAMTTAGYLTSQATGSQQSPDLFGWLLIAGQTAALATRRIAPLRSLLVIAALTVTYWIADYATTFDTFSILAVYAATAHGSQDRRVVWRTVAAAVALLTTIATIGVLSPDEDLPAAAIIGIATIHISAAIAGEIVYDRRRRLSELEQRAVRAEAERELMARQAVLDERGRIARDLHDVVAHGMSVMVVQAGAAERIVATQPERAAEALEHIQSTGREALTEMRRMLGVLRDEHHAVDLAPQPTMGDLEDVVRHCIDSGIPTELIVDGDPPERAVGAEMTGYRIVQEALTNVIKHAGRPVRAVVKITYTPAQIRIEVIDDGEGSTMGEIDAGHGHGIIGMGERVDLFQGSLHAGPRPGGGFRVSARIPLDTVGGRT